MFKTSQLRAGSFRSPFIFKLLFKSGRGSSNLNFSTVNYNSGVKVILYCIIVIFISFQQACGRKLLPEKSFNSLVMCQMGTGTVPATFKSWEYCSKVNSIDYNTLYNCYADRTEGMNALIKMEQLSADNGHTFIPWFALNGVRSRFLIHRISLVVMWQPFSFFFIHFLYLF